MICEPTDAYDLVMLILFLIFDNDCCCRCACSNKNILLCALRFCINYVTTLGQIVIIALTNEGATNMIESMTPTSRALYSAAIVMFSVFGCPMKTQHPSDALSCDLSKVVNKCVMYIYYLLQKQRYRTKISILATAQTYDVTSASKLR